LGTLFIPICGGRERPKAEALGYLEAKAKAKAKAKKQKQKRRQKQKQVLRLRRRMTTKNSDGGER
jgi:hypothetical protein